MFKTKTFTLNDMQSNLIGNGDTNKDLHLKPEESAPIVRDYYKTQKVETAPAEGILVVNGELFLNSLEEVFIREEEKKEYMICGFDCQFHLTLMENKILNIYYRLDETKKKKGTSLYSIALAHSAPPFNREALKIETDADIDEAIAKGLLQPVITGDVLATKSIHEANYITFDSKVYDIEQLLGDKVDKAHKAQIILDDSFNSKAGWYELRKEVNGRKVFNSSFVFNNAVISSFCNSLGTREIPGTNKRIGVSVEEYLAKYNWTVTPMLCAYTFVPKFCEIADDKITKDSLLEDAKKTLGDKIRSYEDIDVKKMYLAQKVVPDMRYRMFFENHDGSIHKKIHLISSYAPGKNPRIIPIDRRNPDIGFMRATTINTTVLDDSGHPYIGGTGTLLEQVYNKLRKSA